jgi:hypothetical protein
LRAEIAHTKQVICGKAFARSKNANNYARAMRKRKKREIDEP